MSYYLQVLERQRLVFAGEIRGALEIGRQQRGETALYRLQKTPTGSRLVIAAVEERRIGRRQLLLNESSPGTLTIENLSENVRVEMAHGGASSPSRLEAQAPQTVQLPITIALPGGFQLSIHLKSPEDVHSLEEATSAPGRSVASRGIISHAKAQWTSNPGTEHLVKTLQTIMDLFQSSSTPEELFQTAIAGAVELAQFDRAQILLLKSGTLQPVSMHSEDGDWTASQTILLRVLSEVRTFWQSGADNIEQTKSLANIEMFIAAPILDPEGTVLGVLYGDRKSNLPSIVSDGVREITRVDARLMELLAGGVAAGLARMAQSQNVQRMRSQFEQFFTKELALELERNPDLLVGRDAEISVLFCDIRGFTRICDRVGAKGTFQWINEVMDVLSACVMNHEGVVVDYIGDELMAMWGAPHSQPDHAHRACQCALDMLSAIPELNRRLYSLAGEEVDLGIGISSGPVLAGNTGSKQKFKYGPLGTTVNVASRVQGSTKHFKTRILITGSTAEQLDEFTYRRRLGSVRVVNIHSPVELWELVDPSLDEKLPVYCKTYAEALEAFEAGEFQRSAKILSDLLSEKSEDGPSLVLLKRVVNALVDGAAPEHPVWVLPTK